MSNGAAGGLMIACGLGMAWSARAYVSVRVDWRAQFEAAARRRYGGRLPWRYRLRILMAPRTQLVMAYVFAAAAVVAGVLVLL